MSKNVLVIASSLRKNGNSNTLANAFLQGAIKSGHHGELLYLSDYKINFCQGCLACQTTHQCVINDDVIKILEKMKKADVIAFASPLYFYEMSGQLKTLLDRTNPLYGSDYNFKDIYLLVSGAEKQQEAIEGIKKGLSGWIECFEKTNLAGVVFANEVTAPDDIDNHVALTKAYELAKAL